MSRNICVFAAASCDVAQIYHDAARETGRYIGREGDTLLFGAGDGGLMGGCARAVHAHGGKVIGVIPQGLNSPGVAYPMCDELVVTAGLRERKAVFDDRAHAFVALPGGFGTMEELLEIITLKQLGVHQRPVVVLNINGYYDLLLAQFEVGITQSFARAACRSLYHVADDVKSGFDFLNNFFAREN